MSSRPNPYSLHVIYISHLAPGEDYRAFDAVCEIAHRVNPALGVGGALLFDGRRFCQWLHGGAGPISALLTAIALDRRHIDFKLLYLGNHDFKPAVSSWCNGVVPSFALDEMDNQKMGMSQVLPMFMRALSEASP